MHPEPYALFQVSSKHGDPSPGLKGAVGAWISTIRQNGHISLSRSANLFYDRRLFRKCSVASSDDMKLERRLEGSAA